MFENGARLDDIVNVLRPPKIDTEEDPKKQQIPDSAFRYASKRSMDDDKIKFDLLKLSEGLK